MIISRTPFRISLFGGGTDYPGWFVEHGGAVLGLAIDKYCYISARVLPPFFDHRFRVVYSKVELVRQVDEIQHPAVRGVLSEMGTSEGLEIHHDADLPARAGLGSSSSFTVGLLNAVNALRGRMVTKQELSEKAIYIEQEVLKEAVGCQDQIWAAYGGLNRIDFRPDSTFAVTPIILPPDRREELRRSLMLVFTGFARFATDFAQEQINSLQKKRRQLALMREMVDEAAAILCDPHMPIAELGKLLHESWQLKRELADKLTNNRIDEIYDAGCAAGAIGGKLLGAGGGGFVVFVVEPSQREKVQERLKQLIHVTVNYDLEGSKIVLYQPNGL